MPHEFTDQMDADRRQWALGFWMDEFSRQWSEANLSAEDLNYIKTVRAWLWGPGTVLSESEYLRAMLGRDPSEAEVIEAIEHAIQLMEPCYEAMGLDPEFNALADEDRRKRNSAST